MQASYQEGRSDMNNHTFAEFSFILIFFQERVQFDQFRLLLGYS